jgi:hypothetical protein
MSEPTSRSSGRKSEGAAPLSDWVISLGEVLDAEVVGKKAATLGGLMRAGFAVPDGFVISTTAFPAAASARSMTPVCAKPSARRCDDSRRTRWRCAPRA